MLLIGRREVEELLEVDALIDALGEAMADLSAGRASVPQRVGALVEERSGMLAAMLAYVPSISALTAKLISLFPENEGTTAPTHQGIVAVFDPESGTPVALLDGTSLTAIRTGAGSALSTRLLAREEASVLAILGTGVQARSHAAAVTRVRDFSDIRVAGRDPARSESLASALDEELQAKVTASPSWRAACEGADVVCATTHAVEPVVRREWIAPGTHITSVGYNVHGREVDNATVADSRVVVESRAAALANYPSGSNDLREPMELGLIDEGHIHAEIGELVTGERPGREAEDQLTLYKSVGVAVQDAAAAALVLRKALETGAGQEIELYA